MADLRSSGLDGLAGGALEISRVDHLLEEIRKELGADAVVLSAFSSPGETITTEPFVCTAIDCEHPRVAYERFAEHMHEQADQLVCRRCGCSYHDPCGDDAGFSCSWASHDPPLCSCCKDVLSEEASVA